LKFYFKKKKGCLSFLFLISIRGEIHFNIELL
jgi:hypothetical protein